MKTGEIFIWPLSGGDISKHPSKPETPKEKNDRPDYTKTSNSETVRKQH